MKTILLLIAMFFVIPIVHADEKYVAQGDVYIREAPPNPPLYRNAKEIGIVKKGETVILLEKTNVFFYEWFKVEIIRDNKIVGWVYNGEKNGTPYFEKVGGD